MSFRFIEVYRNRWAIGKMAKVLTVSSSVARGSTMNLPIGASPWAISVWQGLYETMICRGCRGNGSGSPQIEPGDIELMEKILSIGLIQYKFAVRIQAVLGRVRRQPANNLDFILGMNAMTVSRYVHRFNEGGVDALLRDKTRKPGKQPISTEVKNELSRIVCNEKPAIGTHWSTRELAKRLKIDIHRSTLF